MGTVIKVFTVEQRHRVLYKAVCVGESAASRALFSNLAFEQAGKDGSD